MPARQQGATLRKLLSACVVGVLVGAFGVAGAAVAVPVLDVRDVRAATADPVSAIDVEAYADNDIVSVKATIRPYRSQEVLALLDGFQLLSGTVRDGVWRSTTQPDLTGWNVDVIVHLKDSTGYWKNVFRSGVILNGLRPVFAEFGVTPDHVDADHDDVTYRGRIVIRRDDGTEYGLEGLRLYVHIRSSNMGWSSPAVTGTDGWFTGTFTSAKSVSVSVEVLTTATYVGVLSDPVTVTGRVVPTRVSIGVAPLPSPYYVVGDTVTVSGKLEGQNWSDEWYALAGHAVRIYHHNSETQTVRLVATATTGADGSYSASVRVPAPGSLRVAYGASPSGWAYAEETTEFLAARYRIMFTGFNVSPEPVAKGGAVTAQGKVSRVLSDGSTVPATDGLADLYFSTDKSIWTHVAQRAVGSNGAFSIPATATKDGYWRVAYTGGTNNFSGMTGSDYVDTRYKTTISSFNASPEPVRYGDPVTVSGKLSGYTTSWAPLSGRTVYVYFVPKGSTTATYMGSDSTNSSGVFKRSFTAKRDGYWYARYKGSSTYVPVTTFRDFVEVA